MRKTPLSPMLLANIDCFPPDQLEKILNIDPEHTNGKRTKARFGLLAEVTDFRKGDVDLFKARNKPRQDVS